MWPAAGHFVQQFMFRHRGLAAVGAQLSFPEFVDDFALAASVVGGFESALDLEGGMGEGVFGLVPAEFECGAVVAAVTGGGHSAALSEVAAQGGPGADQFAFDGSEVVSGLLLVEEGLGVLLQG